MNDLALTVKQAAELLQVSPTTIYAQARGGKIPAHRIGGSWRFFEVELRAGTKYNPWERSAHSRAALRSKARA
jgi:excisionase family DNA binding protein